MLLLATFLDRPTEKDDLRHYQRDHWGTQTGENCVIELSGLAAPNFGVPRDRTSFREDRIAVIRDRIRQYQPVLVVMSGTRDLAAWEAIAGQPFPRTGILKAGSTVLVTTPHTVSHGMTNQYWVRLGLELQRVAV